MHCLKCFVKILCLVVVLDVFIVGCSSINEKTTDKSSVGEDKIVIGFSMDTLVHERWLSDRDIFVARANELGAEVIVQTANSDSVEQEKQVEYLLDQNIDILVLVPNDAAKAANLVKAAKNRGVRVISYDRLVKNANVDLYISFDNILVGELMGKAILKSAPKGNYLVINGSPSDNNSYMFNEGYKKTLSSEIENSSIKLVGETWVKGWLYEDAFKYVEDTINSGTQVDAIIGANDTLASAAIDVLAEKRLTSRVKVIGQDADLDACQRVVEGTQIATVYKPIDKIARTAAEYAITMAKGGLVQTNDSINDGKYDVPYFKIAPELVTKDNMVDVIINDRFHRLEDVYINIPKSQWPKTKQQ